MAQNFNPDEKIKVMREGCPAFEYFYITNGLYNKGLLSKCVLLKMFHRHYSVFCNDGRHAALLDVPNRKRPPMVAELAGNRE